MAMVKKQLPELPAEDDEHAIGPRSPIRFLVRWFGGQPVGHRGNAFSDVKRVRLYLYCAVGSGHAVVLAQQQPRKKKPE
jgi:hypothetical protein